MDKSQISSAMSEFYSTDGMPVYYDMVGRSVLLYPAPSKDDVTLAKGLKMYFARDISPFAITDTATEPGFDNHFHRMISLGSAYDYCLANGIDDRKNQIRERIGELKIDLQEHYGGRHRELPPRKIPKDKDQI